MVQLELPFQPPATAWYVTGSQPAMPLNVQSSLSNRTLSLTSAGFTLMMDDNYLLLNGNGVDFVRMCTNGDVYVKGELVENDRSLVESMREWIDAVTVHTVHSS